MDAASLFLPSRQHEGIEALESYASECLTTYTYPALSHNSSEAVQHSSSSTGAFLMRRWQSNAGRAVRTLLS